MGIPSYFSWLVRHFEKKIITTQPPFQSIDQLYLDFNCAIHPVSRSHPEYSIERMCTNITIYLEYLINYVQPKELIYVAIDGVAPVAKIKQQRLRRYKSVKETAETNELKKQFGVAIPADVKDFNMISPATEFMSILSAKITHFLSKYTGVCVIFSDSSVPAEGEHKILQHIKTQPLNKNCVIYGLDSDLIMLSLCTKKDNISLIRENTNEIDIELKIFPTLDYFLISELRNLLFVILVTDCPIEHMEKFDLVATKVPSGYDIDCIIKDYIFMSFLLGNDFLPPFPTLKIREHGIEKIIYAYRETLKNNDDYLCQENLSINMPFFTYLIRSLSVTEENDLSRQKEIHDRRMACIHLSEPLSFLEANEQYQRVEHLSKDYIDVSRDDWQTSYYQYFFHSKEPKKICEDYLIGLQWNMYYYFDQCADWYWFYHHDATPLLGDFLKYLECSTVHVQFTHKCPVQPYHQLLMILPPQSAHLLPYSYRTYMLSDESPLIHYYPIKCELEYYGKQYRWEAHPRIPFIDPQELQELLGGPKGPGNLTPDEILRGRINSPKYINSCQ
jgi:5'-3' exonuclease